MTNVLLVTKEIHFFSYCMHMFVKFSYKPIVKFNFIIPFFIYKGGFDDREILL